MLDKQIKKDAIYALILFSMCAIYSLVQCSTDKKEAPKTEIDLCTEALLSLPVKAQSELVHGPKSQPRDVHPNLARRYCKKYGVDTAQNEIERMKRKHNSK
jgi:hypothetical protein